MSLFQSPVLFQHNKEDIYLFTLKNNRGVEISISNLGAIIQSFIVPDRSGIATDIVLGFDSIAQYLEKDYLDSMTYLGAIVGRYANRIGNACFEIDGELFTVSENLPPHQIHGGHEGFDRKAWKPEILSGSTRPKLKLSYLSKDGEEGFPGNLQVTVSFELNEENELILITEAITDKATPVNLTHHDYFNLNGAGLIEDHWVELPSALYLGQHEDYVSNGEFHPVAGTKYDFTKAKQIGQDWEAGEGYDQSFVLDKKYGSWGRAAMAFSDRNGLKLEVYTDEPTVQFYTGKHLNLGQGKMGQTYLPFTGFCFETQHHTNALNIKGFPETILRPGQVYKHKTIYQVSTVQDPG